MEQAKQAEIGKICYTLLFNVNLLETIKPEIIKRLATLKEDRQLLIDLCAYYIFFTNQIQGYAKDFGFMVPVLRCFIVESETDPFTDDLKKILESAERKVEESLASIKNTDLYCEFLKDFSDFMRKNTENSFEFEIERN